VLFFLKKEPKTVASLGVYRLSKPSGSHGGLGAGPQKSRDLAEVMRSKKKGVVENEFVVGGEVLEWGVN
jgi:hypothetical protein